MSAIFPSNLSGNIGAPRSLLRNAHCLAYSTEGDRLPGCYGKDGTVNVPDPFPANDGKTDERCEQEEYHSDFRNLGLDPFPELWPIKLGFVDGLDEIPIQIIQCW